MSFSGKRNKYQRVSRRNRPAGTTRKQATTIGSHYSGKNSRKRLKASTPKGLRIYKNRFL